MAVSIVNRFSRAWGALWGRTGPRVVKGLQAGEPQESSGPTIAPVTFSTAMQVSAFWAAARLWSETVSTLPIIFYTDKEKKNPVTAGMLPELFAGKVNRYQTKIEFFLTFILNLVVHGNAYALKQFVGARLVGLIPLMSAQMETKLLADGTIIHCHYSNAGVTVYAAEAIWHCKLFGNGIVGLSPLGHGAKSIGIAIAAENRAGLTYKNGGKPTGILTIDNVLKPEQREQIKKEFQGLREGNTDELMVLEAGLKYTTVSLSPEQVQLLESRQFQIADIARFMGVPSVLINDTSGTTVWGSGIAQIITGWYKLNLRPILQYVEESMEINLQPLDGERLFSEFNMNELLRHDLETRIKANAAAVGSAQMTPNEARADEGREPKPGGDALLVNGNMIPVTSAGKQPATKPKPEDAPDQEEEDNAV
jgi:HK97 family phage portal protein